MNDPVAMSFAFKHKAMELRDIVAEHLPTELRVGMALLEAMSPAAMTTAFAEQVACYSPQIKEHDADFFLSDTVGTDPTLMALRASWHQLPVDKQACVWQVLPMMCNISKRYVKLVTEHP